MKGITRAAMAAVSITILGGCTTAMAPPLTPIVPAEKCVIERNYTVGKRQTAYVGQPMVKVVEKNVRQNYLIMSPLADFRLTGNFLKKLMINYEVSITGSKTGRYPLIGSMRIDGSTYYVVDMQDAKDTSYAVLIGLDNKLTERYLLNDDHDYLMPATGATLVPGEVTFTLNGGADDADPSNTVVRYGTTNFELIYRGVNNVAMEMTYREYTPDYRDDPSLFEALQSGIRKVVNEHPDALGQSLAYPLGTATVTVKNLKIRIHEATGDRIVYTVLDDGLKD